MNRIFSKNAVWRVAIILICLVLITSAYFSSIAARYASEKTTNPQANVAKFHGGSVTYIEFSAKMVNATEDVKYYAFEAEIKLTFEACDVDRDFKFALYLDSTGSISTIPCPADYANGLFLKYNPNAADINSPYDENANLSDFTGSGSFKSGEVYYSVAENGGEEVWHTISNAKYASDGNKIIFYFDDAKTDDTHSIDNGNHVYEFTVLFFVAAKAQEGVNVDTQLEENAYIKYDLECVQAEEDA